MDISSALQDWYAIHNRDLPWRKTDSPYLIWISEVILQQTRVVQGTDYYLRFTERFPGVEDLAAAPADEVMLFWQGLGYYSRAVNMHETAKYIVRELNGVFPTTYAGLLGLKGVGKYTAAAVASIAYREPVAVVDGNVLRVIARLEGIELPVDSAAGRNACERIAQVLISRKRPDIHNQAVMELGALVCLPRKPLCHKCPLAASCVALKNGKADILPVKRPKKKSRIRYFHYFFITVDEHTWIRKRSGRDIWHTLFEFPMIETDAPVELQDMVSTPEWSTLFPNHPVGVGVSGTCHYKHLLTHQTLNASFYHVDGVGRIESIPGYIRVKLTDLDNYALPRLLVRFLEDIRE